MTDPILAGKHTLDDEQACIGLGSNLGDSAGYIRMGIELISGTPGIKTIARSSLYRSAPVDAEGPDFLNAVILVETVLDASALLAALQSIEKAADRRRPFRNAPRTLDLDILLHGCMEIDSPGLTIPHPRMLQRAFVIRPLMELAPDLVLAGHPIAEWAARVEDQRCERVMS